MKIRLIILGLLIAVAVPAFAQLDTVRSNKNEFSIGLRFFPRQQLPLQTRLHDLS